ncbi:MAG: response regulator [Actinobacteria bacterium]|nr:response regulator [Actinomycetota bacterium]
MTRILVVEDEPQIARALRTSLGANGYEVEWARVGGEALDLSATWAPDCLILDLGLPDIDGIEVIRRLRGWSEVPVIVLSVRDSRDDKVRALDAGADDYVNKPFAIDELLARIRATLRRVRPSAPSSPVLCFGELEVDLDRTQVRRGGSPLHLTPTEWALLEAFVTNPGKLLTHQWMLRRVWGQGYTMDQSHYLRIYVRQLRQKLGDDVAEPRYVATERGMGYRWIYDA